MNMPCPKHKIIFLDFDGVLNSARYNAGHSFEANFSDPPLELEWWADGLDPAAVALVDSLARRTGAKVVISSAWRGGLSLGALRRILELRGFTGEVIGVTPQLSGSPRCEQIRTWLLAHGQQVANFVILDDDGEADVGGRFVQTDSDLGLTEADVERAAALLGEA
jgi:HAD domain in Swiss Army Knife RNA repair proteins